MNRQTFFVVLLVAGILLNISEVEGKLGHFSSLRKLLRRKRDTNGIPGNGMNGVLAGGVDFNPLPPPYPLPEYYYG